MMLGEKHAALVAAHRRNDLDVALALARELAVAGWWDRLVAATLVAYGANGDPVTDRALLELVRIEGALRLAADPASEECWQGVLATLIGAGRVTDAVVGIRLAAVESRIGPGPWKVLIALLIDTGHYSEAIAVGRLAAEVNPGDVELQALLALLACECDELDEAAAAIDRALGLEPGHPMVWVARGWLALARRDEPAGAAALETAHMLGADADVIDWIRRLGQVRLRYGV